jgi:SAM-dependent methyltransferase
MSTITTISEWFATQNGQCVIKREQAIVDNMVADIFGFNAVQLGLSDYQLLRGSRIPYHIKAGKGTGIQLCLEAEELPFETGSIDLILLPHTLEFSSHPHQILREVERVLRPEGSVIISGFNPLSLWGLRQVLWQKKGYPWCGHFISLLRLKDWMALLSFEVEAGRFCCYVPPFAGSTLLNRSNNFEPKNDRWWSVIGGVYVLQAKKRIPGMRLVKPNWNGRLVRKLLPVSAKLNKESNAKISISSSQFSGYKNKNE